MPGLAPAIVQSVVINDGYTLGKKDTPSTEIALFYWVESINREDLPCPIPKTL